MCVRLCVSGCRSLFGGGIKVWFGFGVYVVCVVYVVFFYDVGYFWSN